MRVRLVPNAVRRRIARTSVRSRLGLLGLVVLLPVCGALVLATVLAHRSHEAQVRRQTVALAVAVSDSFERQIADARRLMVAIAARPLIGAVDPKRCDPILTTLLASLPRFANTGVADRSGRIVCSAKPQPGGVPASVARSAWFREVRRTNVFTVGAPFVGPITGRWVVVLAQPIRRDGEVRGYVAFPLDLVSLPALTDLSRLPAGSTVGAIDASGTIVTRAPDPGRWVGRNSRRSEIGEIVARNSRATTTAVGTGIDGVERVFGIARAPVSGWQVYVAVPTASAFADARNAALVASAVLALAVVLALTVGELVARSIRRPLLSLSAVAEARGGGDAGTRAAEDGPSELAGLARSFNAMLDAEAQTRRALDEAERHYGDVFNALGDPVMVVDAAERVVTDASPAVRDVLGYEPEELIGSSTRLLYADEDAFLRVGALALELQVGAVTRVITEIRRRDATPLTVESVIRRRTNASTDRDEFILMFRDVTERARAQAEIERLLEAERMARAEADKARAHVEHVLGGIGDGFVAFDRELRVTYVNARASELLERVGEPQQLVGKKYLEVYPEVAGSALHLALQRGLAVAEPFQFEDHYEPWDTWFENRVYPTADGVSFFFHDITDRKRAEAATQAALAVERETRWALDSFIAAAPIGIAFFDRDLRHVIVNEPVAEITGVPVAGHIGRTSDEVSPPGTPSLESLEREVLETGKEVRLELEGVRTPRYPDGDSVFAAHFFQVASETGEPTGIGAFVEDVTEARRVSKALVSYTERLENLRLIDADILRVRAPAETAAAGLARLRDLVPFARAVVAEFEPDGDMVTPVAAAGVIDLVPPVGRVSLEALGHDFDGVLEGRSLLIDDLQLEGPAAPPFDALRDAGVRGMCIVPLVVEGGTIGLLSLAGDVPGQYGDAEVEIAREVADQLAVALQQAQLREQAARHADELEQRVVNRTAELAELNSELDAFSYTISHDLRAPLRAMKGFSQALAEDYGDAFDKDARDLMDRIVRAAQRMDELISGVLDYSRLTRTEIRSAAIDAEAVVDDVLHTLASRIAEVGADVHVERPLGRVLAHHPTLVMSISNLVDNALTYVEPGTTPHVEIRSEPLDGLVRLWVADTGIGVAPEHHERIFGVFERLHGEEAYAGTGIGLASVRKGVERMGGRVGVESEPGRGSSFWVELRAEEGSR